MTLRVPSQPMTQSAGAADVVLALGRRCETSGWRSSARLSITVAGQLDGAGKTDRSAADDQDPVCSGSVSTAGADIVLLGPFRHHR